MDNFLEVLNFNWLFLKLNCFDCGTGLACPIKMGQILTI